MLCLLVVRAAIPLSILKDTPTRCFVCFSRISNRYNNTTRVLCQHLPDIFEQFGLQTVALYSWNVSWAAFFFKTNFSLNPHSYTVQFDFQSLWLNFGFRAWNVLTTNSETYLYVTCECASLYITNLYKYTLNRSDCSKRYMVLFSTF